MERGQAICLLCVGAFLTLILAYFDEAYCGFKFLTNSEEVLNLVVFASILTVLPISLFYGFRETRLKKYSFLLALSGYIPAIFVIGHNIL